MKYDILRGSEAKAAKEQEKEIFRTIIIARTEGGTMHDGEKFIYELIFKPNNPELRLSSEQILLLLSYYAELLQQIERN
jgi:hypothetical protein